MGAKMGYVTISIQEETKKELTRIKTFRRETYDEIILKLIKVFKKERKDG